MILVVNFGSQFAHLIARRVREHGVHAEIVPHNITAERISEYNPDAIILSGGPDSVLAKGSLRPDAKLFSLGIPTLGICYGQQLIAHELGGRVVQGDTHEYGKETFTRGKGSKLFTGIQPKTQVWFSHGDTVATLPQGFESIGKTSGCRYAAIADTKRAIFGLQFHPEVTHTTEGSRILENFLFSIAGATKDWRVSSIRKDIIAELRTDVPEDEHVLIAVSGGVDSLVAATLLYEALGERVHAVLVDTGLLRKNEAAEVHKSLRALGMHYLEVHDASKTFLRKLKGVTDPEEKRTIIGHTFIEEFESYVKNHLKHYPITHLAQGTIYPDRIESAAPSTAAAKIKSHHNLTLPEKMNLTVVEPIRELYKDEVRTLGRSLGLPKHLLDRHPFPGPGLAIRVLGEVTPERVAILQEADAIYLEELRTSKHYGKIWQAFAALLPVQSVGVMGDARTYESVVSLRAVNSVDGMTADWYPMPPDVLGRISNRIVNEVRGVNRVLYDVTQKPPGTIEYE